MSRCDTATVAANSAVAAPTQAMSVGTQSDDTVSTGLTRVIRYTPDVTIVAAWMSADTGVGPAMASGSHTYSGSCADLPQAPTKSSTAMAGAVVVARPPAPLMIPGSPEYGSVPSAWNVKNMATMKPQPPRRFVTNAFLPATALPSSVNQNEMSQYEQ